MSTSTTIVIEGLEKSLPSAEPHLMPFHIEYTGTAPLSLYYLFKPCTSDAPDASSKSLKSRFTSVFRGRKMKGLRIHVPEGYVGVTLSRIDTEGSTSQHPASQHLKEASGTTQRSTRFLDHIDDDDIAMGDSAKIGGHGTRKKFVATGTFPSFLLWNPDVDVDESEDQYVRFLSEYRNLLGEIHKTND